MGRPGTIITALAAGVLLMTAAAATGIGNRDVLRLAVAGCEDGQLRVAVHVVNHEELAGLDIPIRFGAEGDPIELVRVDFAPRVADWDFTHAQIDNQGKTVILGLISELVNIRADADMKVAATGNTRIADLVFRVDGDFDPRFETFTTKSPGHELTFIYNEMIDGQLTVQTVTPEFEVDVDFKNGVVPDAYALSENFPNPFNPQTSFTLSLPEASDYAIRIFNVAGQLVKTFEGHAEAGVHTITWDGRNDQGSQVASGVYFMKAQANTFEATRKMLMIK